MTIIVERYDGLYSFKTDRTKPHKPGKFIAGMNFPSAEAVRRRVTKYNDGAPVELVLNDATQAG